MKKSAKSNKWPKGDAKPRRGIFHSWAWELLALGLSAGPLVAIIVVLVKYDNEELPQWPYNINVNTLIAVLSTLVRAAQVMVLNEIIGQAKWARFSRRAGAVQDFQTFDEASRGTLGCFNLLGFLRVGLRGSILAVVAAVVTILSLASDAFTQQALNSVPCGRPDNKTHSTVPVAFTIPGTEQPVRTDPGSSSINTWDLALHVKSALINGLAVPDSNDTAVQADCPTGNCTFVEELGVSHSTMGMCTQCVDITKHAKVIEGFPVPNITLGNQWIQLKEGSPLISVGEANVSTYESDMPSDFLFNSQQGFANISVLTISDCGGLKGKCPFNVNVLSQSVGYIGAICTLYPCMKDFTARVDRGKLKEKVVSTTPARVNGDWDDSYQYETYSPSRLVVKSPCVVDGKLYNTGNFSSVPKDDTRRAFENILIGQQNVSVPTDCYYQIHGNYAIAIRKYLTDSLLAGFCFLQPTGGGDGIAVICEDRFEGYHHDMFWLISLFANQNATLDTISSNFENLATAATNFFRKDGFGILNTTASLVFGSASKAQVLGQVQRSTVCLELSWPWLLYPGILWLITVILIIVMIISNFRHPEHPVWKSSLLPFLLFCLDPWAQRQDDNGVRRPHNLSHLDDMSKEVSVQLDTNRQLESYGLLQKVEGETTLSKSEQKVNVNEWEPVPLEEH